ncbi:lytic murein transglycosylase [Xenorhabdus szentirmaii]|uniref:Lytic murein transglycosylase n=1 Tax=Xenorhabdus szentirmaii TaxID=290112 RepID=A0AAW3YQH8_9GAMM|nr:MULTISPECIES: lytic murein transglycosylase [unclassified Xenorhabdus]MBD2792891.1 lytic murein transglycosylase [Xenorhabdus sp. CUL]MBD2799871.1 lytic murein transglycosylase [Xenorhabdus sp. M]MBD2823771.1 lytic murein transglycosylase [Xenorhabdus sp. 5]
MKLITGMTLLTATLLSGCNASCTAGLCDKQLNNQPALTAQSKAEVRGLEQHFPLDSREPSQFPAYVALLKQQAREQGFSETTLDRAFADIHFIPRVIKADRNQPEKKITLDDYLKRVLPTWKIEQGVAQYKNHLSQLAKISHKYKVPEAYIVALWGLESGFGKLQGKEDVISALSTLAFEGRREVFFIKQLLAALEIMESQYIDENKTLKGSWAGAMGQNQFMPTSYLTYGADGDDDGKIDIWDNKTDVFASTANYLAKEGWQQDLPWGYRISLPADFDMTLEGIKTEQGKTIAQWQMLGVSSPHLENLPANTKGWIVIPDDPAKRAFWVTQNFRTIMHWNRSYYFALSVGMMADGITQRTHFLTH